MKTVVVFNHLVSDVHSFIVCVANAGSYIWEIQLLFPFDKPFSFWVSGYVITILYFLTIYSYSLIIYVLFRLIILLWILDLRKWLLIYMFCLYFFAFFQLNWLNIALWFWFRAIWTLRKRSDSMVVCWWI